MIGFKIVRKNKNSFFIRVIGCNIFYYNRHDSYTKYRLLWFHWQKLNYATYDDIQSIKHLIIDTCKVGEQKDHQYSTVKKNNSNIVNLGKIRPKSALIIEPNNYHGELLPGVTNLFLELGYNVDIITSYTEFKNDPLCAYKIKKLRIAYANLDQILEYISSNEKSYDSLFFNSESCNYGKNKIYNILKLSDYSKCIFTLHHLASCTDLPEFIKNVVSLKDFKQSGSIKPHFLLNPFFGNINVIKSNKIKEFLVIGNIDPQRKNFNLLIDTVSLLVNRKYTNFIVKVISRKGEFIIPSGIAENIKFLGSLSYVDMYRELQHADFILPLLDFNNQFHKKYIDECFTGSILLSLGFRVPCIIDSRFAEAYSLSDCNALVYSNNDLYSKLYQAINIDKTDYLKLQLNLSELAIHDHERSLDTLKQLTDHVMEDR